MDVALQKHGAKHIYRVPEGLRELCADISREVLRAQPSKIYCFIADYIDALLITRENAKVAVRVVNNILLGSESIVDILHQSGLSLEQIAAAAPRIQKAFRTYLDFVDVHQAGVHEQRIDENSRICIRNILESTGTTWEQAEVAASTIQAAFRNHYKEMLAREARGEIQWQRAVVNTMAILRRAGVSQEEASRAATLIQSSYRGYYIRRNVKLSILSGGGEAEKTQNEDILEPRETIQAVAWMDMMFEDSKHTIERANEAATTIQSAFRGYRTRAIRYANKVDSTQSMVVEAILDNLRSRVWSKVKSLENYPEEFGSREEMEETVDKIETEYKNKQRKIRLSQQLNEEEATEEDDEDGAESGTQDLETGVEISLDEEKETNSYAAMKSEAETEPEEQKEQQGEEPVVAQEPDPQSELKTEPIDKDLQEDHKEHNEMESSDNSPVELD